MQQRSLSDSKKISTGPNNLLPSRCAFGLVFPFVRFGRIGGNADAIAISFGRILRGIAVAGFGCLAKIDRLLLRQPRAHVGFDLCDIHRVDHAIRIYVFAEIRARNRLAHV